MKHLILLLIATSVFAQSVAQLPTTWVNSNEWNGLFSTSITFPSASMGGAWSCSGMNFGPYTAGSFASLQQAVNDMESCRTIGGGGLGIVLNVPPGAFTATGNNGLIIPQTNPVTSSTFLVIRSTLDANLPAGQTVCAHGIQDNLATSTNIGLVNPDCSGKNMYYQLGPTLTGGVISGLTTLSVNTTTLAGIGAQTSTSNIDDSATGFGNCGLSCAGGTGSATSPIQTFGNVSPSLDGGSMNLGLTGPSLAAGHTTNYLWYWNAGANNSATSFTSTWHVYIPSISLIQEMEFDTKLFAGGHRWFWGSQCAPNSGNWDIWDQLHGAWVSTAISCTLTAATWHTVLWNVHRVSGDTSCASSEPCDYYDSLFVDGVNVTPGGGFPAQPSGPSGDADNTGNDTQIDMNATGGITSAYYDEMSFSAAVPATQCIALANGYIAPGIAVVVDSGINQETVVTSSGANQTGMCGTFTKTHAAGVAVTYNVGAFTLANGTVTNTFAYNDAASMWTIQAQATGNSTAVTFCYAVASGQTPTCAQNLGPDHWIIQDMEARLFAGNLGNAFIVQVGGVSNDTSQAQLSTRIHFQRSWFHGDWTSTLTGANAIAGGLDLECLYCSLMDSQISEILRPGNESHPATVQGDQVKLNHNWADSGSEGFFSGGFSGGSGPTIFGWTAFCDVEVRRNRFSYPFAWLGQSPILGGANPNYPTNFSTVRKNSQENKSGCRAEFSGNIMEDVDNSGAQNGVMTELNPRNNSSGNGTNYLATVHDMTVQNNIYRNGCQAINVTTSNAGPGGGTAYPPRNLEISDNLWYNIGITNYGCSSFSGLQSNSGGGTWQGTITQTDLTHETFVAECSVDLGGCKGQVNAVTITGGACGGSPSLSFSTPNIAGGNLPKATVHCSGSAFSAPSLTQFGSGYTSQPTVTLTCSGCSGGPVAAATINAASSGISTATGFQAFNVTLGDPIAIDMCQTASFNTVGTTLHSGSYVPSGIGPPSTSASTVWTGSFAAGNVTVSTTHVGTPAATETSHYCKFTTLQGAPYNLHWNHNTLVGNSTHVINSSQGFNNSDTDGPNFQVNAAIQNSLFTAGDWGSSSVGAGTVAQEFNYDAATSLTADHLTFPGQTAANYTAFGLNPTFHVNSPLLYFPTTAYCSGSVPTGSCIGFLGAMSAGAMPLTLPDYHQFALIGTSLFRGGAVNQAPDATDVGVAVPALDVAQTLNLYVCASTCGAGPYPDTPVVPMNQPPAPAIPLFAVVSRLGLQGGYDIASRHSDRMQRFNGERIVGYDAKLGVAWREANNISKRESLLNLSIGIQ